MTSFKFLPNAVDSISLNQKTVGAGSIFAFNDCRQVGWTIEGRGVISSGKVIIRCSHDPEYTGIWHEADSIDLAVTSLSGGALYCGNTPMPLGGFFRAEIPNTDQIVGGGDITVRFNGLLG